MTFCKTDLLTFLPSITLGTLNIKIQAAVLFWLSVKTGNRETASLAHSEGTKISQPAPLKLIEYVIVKFV